MKTGVELIAEERKRQVEKEGWTLEHDDSHDKFELSRAGVSYALIADGSNWKLHGGPFWPWAKGWWRPSPDPIRNLVKAGALIAAEIDRLNRLK